jgi:hypothetical protein
VIDHKDSAAASRCAQTADFMAETLNALKLGWR